MNETHLQYAASNACSFWVSKFSASGFAWKWIQRFKHFAGIRAIWWDHAAKYLVDFWLLQEDREALLILDGKLVVGADVKLIQVADQNDPTQNLWNRYHMRVCWLWTSITKNQQLWSKNHRRQQLGGLLTIARRNTL